MAVQKFKGRVVRNEFITPTVFEIDFALEEKIPFIAGQFFMMKIEDPETPGKNISRAYSIASPPESKIITWCVKLVEGGKGTNYLKNLKLNETTDLSGPYGKFVYKTEKPRIPFFISTGTGIAPYLSIIESQAFKKNPPSKIHCLLGVRTEDEILYEHHFKKNPTIEYVATVSQPSTNWKGFRGRVTHYLQEISHKFDFTICDYYLCGNGAMIKEVKDFLLAQGVLKDHIFQEIYFT